MEKIVDALAYFKQPSRSDSTIPHSAFHIPHFFHSVVFLSLLFVTAAQAQPINFGFPFPGSANPNGQYPQSAWQFRPQDPSNARGAPPSYRAPAQAPAQGPGYQRGPGGFQSGWPGQYGAPYGRQRAQETSRPPRLEVEVGDLQPYVQENVLLKLRVVSEQNLATATPELPNSNDLLLHKLDGPTASYRTGAGGQREIVNEFIYSLTPLRGGDLQLPPLTVAGDTAAGAYPYGSGSGSHYEATNDDKVLLKVRPAMTSVQPWVPLQDLSLNATLDGGEEAEEGEPVTLVLELNAVGATGSQLPSLETHLRSEDFRVYREQTLTESNLSADGRRLEGKRTEYYTLVPRSGGKLHLPEIRLPWWNVNNGTREYASLPIHMLRVEGESGPFGPSKSAQAGDGWGMGWFWMPLLGLVLLLSGYWGGVWYRGRGEGEGRSDREPLVARLGSRVRAVGARAEAGLVGTARRLNPTPVLSRIGPAMRQALPASSRFLGCVRAANRETNPGAWAERFQQMSCLDPSFDPQTPLLGIGGHILRLRPGADREKLERLLQQLDGALYGKQDIDFRRWKKQFGRQVGRGRGAFSRGRKSRFQRPVLPELNPRSYVP